MLPHSYYLLARHEARYHVQVEVVAAGPIERTPGPMPVQGKVIKIFRGDDRLRVGDLVRFQEFVTRKGDEIPCGGIRWKPHDAVLHARFIEVFLDGDPPACGVALCQSMVLDKPTLFAQMGGWHPLVAARHRMLQSLANERRPWWRFWG